MLDSTPYLAALCRFVRGLRQCSALPTRRPAPLRLVELLAQHAAPRYNCRADIQCVLAEYAEQPARGMSCACLHTSRGSACSADPDLAGTY